MSKPLVVPQFEENKPLGALSTFGIGGAARFFTQVQKIEELQAVILHCHSNRLPFFILGKGSNTLFDDRGFDGVVILNKIAFCTFDFPLVHVGAGYSFSLLGNQTARQGWSGLEFASGIPGSVGGAIYMNAGANGSETCETLKEVVFLDETAQIHTLKRHEIQFSYRFSTFQEKKGSIIGATFLLQPSQEARQKQLGIITYRMSTQPYGDKSCGCVFANPPLHSAGALIEKCGLKGKAIGGAEVSTLHANFIINKEKATSQQVMELAAFVKSTVKEQTGIDLEMEIRKVPYSCNWGEDVSR